MKILVDIIDVKIGKGESLVETHEFDDLDIAKKFVDDWNIAVFYVETPEGGVIARIRS